MKTYIVSGENINKLEEILHEHEIKTHHFKHIEAVSFQTDLAKQEIYDLCKDYHVSEEKTYDI